MSEPKTKVCFRVFPDGDVIAIFPDEAWDSSGNLASYQHVGQHGACDPGLLTELRMATAKEWLPLFNELVSLGYELEVADV